MIDTNSFRQEVFSIVTSIPYGKVITYGQIAWIIGKPQYARLVGHALRHTIPGHQLPCHRVVNSQGRTAPHWPEQIELLKSEGVTFQPNGNVNMKANQWNWKDLDSAF